MVCQASIILVIAAGLSAGASTDHLKAAMAYMEHYSTGIHSARLEYRIDYEQVDLSTPTGPPVASSVREEYLWTDRNQKLLRHYNIDEEGNASLWQTTAWDGQKQYGYKPQVQQGYFTSRSESTGFPTTYYNVAYHCAGPRGLLDRLDCASDVAASSTVVEGRSMVELTWRTDDTECSAMLDPNMDYQPVRFQQVTNMPERDRAALAYDMGTVTVTVDEYARVDGYYFPKRTTKTWDLHMHDGSTLRASIERLTLESVKPNVSVGDSQFRIEFPPGTEVTDHDYAISTVVGGPSNETDDFGRASSGLSVESKDPNGVHPPLADRGLSRGYLYALVVAAVVLVLLAGYVRRTKRRV